MRQFPRVGDIALGAGPRYSHIAPEKLESIVKECDSLSAWLADMQVSEGASYGGFLVLVNRRFPPKLWQF